MRRFIAVLLVVLLPACERPFVDRGGPDLVILSPDVSEVLQEPRFVLNVRGGSFRNIESVHVNGTPMEFAESSRAWTLHLSARRGLNQLILEALGDEGEASVDTAYVLHLPSQYVTTNLPLPASRGGHTATMLDTQEIIVAGGSERADGPAQSTLYSVNIGGGGGFSSVGARLAHPRTGHTATRLADGRILFVGGSRSGEISSVAGLVETPEVYDPVTRTVEEWAVVGDPIRRALHQAVYRCTGAGEFVDLYGGLGDTRYGNAPSLGIRPDLRSFQIEGTALRALNSIVSAPYLGDPVYGHTVTRIQVGPYFVFGGRFDSNVQQEVSFSYSYGATGLSVEDAPSLLVPRKRHAAAPIHNNLLLIVGGQQRSAASIVTETEIFSPASRTVFRVPRSPPNYIRFGHTATPIGQGRILIMGGYGPDGTARAASEYYAVLPESSLN